MARKIRSSLDNRTARLDLPVQRKPHAFTNVAPGVSLGYRRNSGANNVWVVRVSKSYVNEHGKRRSGYWTANLHGIPDDYEPANADTVLDFHQAADRARAMSRGQSDDANKPASVGAALDRYEVDLKSRGGSTVNATRVRGHLTKVLLDKPVALLRADELRAWRNGLLASGLKAATVRRTSAVLKACLNLAANLDPRIVDRSAWTVGLSGIKATSAQVSRVISDADVLRIVDGAYKLDSHFGLLIDVLGSTGTRTSQACRLLVADVQNGDAPRLMMPSSRKGGKGRESVRRPVPIPPTLCAKLKQASAGRAPDEPLLVQRNGRAWDQNAMLLCRLFAQVAERLGIRQTSYALRHSSIVRSLLAGQPVCVVAANHDTSTVQLERVYSHFIADHSDAISRRGLLDTAAPPPDENIVPIAGRR
jgi:integrase